MIYYETVSQWLLEYCSIHSWQDIIEILFFSTAIYAVSVWLKQDHSKKLLPAFYGYLGAFCSTYFLDLQVLQTTLLYSAPIVATLSIIYHQKQLQKSFILARKQPIEPQKLAAHNWIETLIRSCLVISHQKKEITCIIENRDDLETIINKPLLLDLHVQKGVLDLLLLSDLFKPSQPIWVKRNGNIVSVNCSWDESIEHNSIVSAMFKQPDWQTYGTVVTEKTDALLFHINSDPAKSGICYKGEVIKKMSSEHMLQFIKQVMHKQSSEPISYSKGTQNETERSSSL